MSCGDTLSVCSTHSVSDVNLNRVQDLIDFTVMRPYTTRRIRDQLVSELETDGEWVVTYAGTDLLGNTHSTIEFRLARCMLTGEASFAAAQKRWSTRLARRDRNFEGIATWPCR